MVLFSPTLVRVDVSCELHPFFVHKLDAGPIRLVTISHAIRIITNSAFNSHTDPKFRKQGILKVNDLFEYQSILFMYDYISGKLPRSFAGTFPLNQDMQQTHTTRQSDLLYIPRYSSRYAQKLPEFHLPKIWNNWVRSLPQNSSRNIIKKFTKSKLLRSYPEHVKCENIHCIECHRRQWSDVCVTTSIS